MEARGLTKGLSSLGRRDGRPCFGRLPFGRVNSDPGQERKSSKSSRLKGQRKVRRTKTHKLLEKREVAEPKKSRGDQNGEKVSFPRCDEDVWVESDKTQQLSEESKLELDTFVICSMTKIQSHT